MGRLALRPGLRAYAHAPAGVDDLWTPESIPGLILWIDPSEHAAGTVTSIADKSAQGISDSVVFTADSDIIAGAITDDGGQGNGLNFLQSTSVNSPRELHYVPTGSPYNTDTVGGYTEDWLIWNVVTLGAPSGSFVSGYGGLSRGRGGSLLRAAWAVKWYHDDTDAYSPKIQTGSNSNLTGTSASISWASSYSGYTGAAPPAFNSSTFVIFFRSFDDAGTRKIEISFDGSTWAQYTHADTSTTIDAAYNYWEIGTSYDGSNSWSWAGIGECGFVDGAGATQANAVLLHTYLTEKWDLDL